MARSFENQRNIELKTTGIIGLLPLPLIRSGSITRQAN
jgi:hypothetical protein